MTLIAVSLALCFVHVRVAAVASAMHAGTHMQRVYLCTLYLVCCILYLCGAKHTHTQRAIYSAYLKLPLALGAASYIHANVAHSERLQRKDVDAG